jgi:hypothetical protein
MDRNGIWAPRTDVEAVPGPDPADLEWPSLDYMYLEVAWGWGGFRGGGY